MPILTNTIHARFDADDPGACCVLGRERLPVIIVLKPDTSDAQIDEVLKRIGDLGFTPHLSKGTQRTIIGVIGDEDKLRSEPLQAIPFVEQVIPVLKPFKLASREKHREETIIDLKGVKIGGGGLLVIAGPCAIEGEDILRDIARHVRAAGANVLRGGAFKPRTSPYSFQGLGEAGLKILRNVGDEVGMPVVTEVMDTRHVELVERYTDMFQIGARNMQNFHLLNEVGQTKKPVLLKRGMGASVKDLLMSAEYVLSNGNQEVILCERGVRSFDESTRNLLDLAAVPNVKGQCHLPIIVDPSHGTGRPDLIPPMARAAIACGADGIHIEVHSAPEKALSDGPQALRPPEFAKLMDEIRKLAALMVRSITYSKQGTRP
jgi:3-deoxy-7-phosphoheptulonate synthase